MLGRYFLTIILVPDNWVSKQLLGSLYVSLSNFFDIPFCEVLSKLSFFMLQNFMDYEYEGSCYVGLTLLCEYSNNVSCA